MTSDARNVDIYFREVPAERLNAMQTIRGLIKEIYRDADETMQYGMPSYSRGGTVELAFNSQKQNIALYLMKKGVADKYRDHFPKSAVGKGCFRYSNPGKIDFELMRQMLKDHYASNEEPC